MFNRNIGRKVPARGVHIQSEGSTIVWLTVCSKDRALWMTQSEVMTTLIEIWSSEARAWFVGDFLLMPDHVHLFCAPHDLQTSIERWMAYWKDRFTKRHPERGWRWQRGGFHYRIRSSQDLAEKWAYTMQNPVRKGLVVEPCEWPWRGHVFDLRW